MKVTLAAIANRAPTDAFQTLAALYLERLQQYTPVESKIYRSEAAFTQAVAAIRARTPPTLVLLDSQGKSFTSLDFAQWIARRRDQGTQHLIFAIGPANGWSEETRSTAAPSTTAPANATGSTRAPAAAHPNTPANPNTLLLSLGPMTLPHELARLVLAEQLYRAFTILANHPYHAGH